MNMKAVWARNSCSSVCGTKPRNLEDKRSLPWRPPLQLVGDVGVAEKTKKQICEELPSWLKEGETDKAEKKVKLKAKTGVRQPSFRRSNVSLWAKRHRDALVAKVSMF